MAAAAGPMAAQCADGSQPPCRARRDPPIDDRTWLVLPFENAARATDAELVRQASVSLLYQELSRWSELRVVSDDRVADLIADVPAASQLRWVLAPSLAIARRAGAGRLVLGDFLAVGGAAQVTARVYDVRTGRLVRTVRDRLGGLQAATGLDSLTVTFRRLARATLDLPVPEGSRASSIGTTSLAAYSEYAAGLSHYRAGFADSALPRFRRALALDSAFALPAIRLQEMGLPDGPRYMDIAARFADRLPPRDRAVLSAYRAIAIGQFEPVCDAASQLLARDSLDAEAWFLAGACELDAFVIEGANGPRFARSFNRALANLLRALSLDVSHPMAFALLAQNLDRADESRAGCSVRTRPCPADKALALEFAVDGDSLVFPRTTTYLRVSIHTRQLPRTRAQYEVTMWRWERRRQFLVRFVQVNPRSWPAHASYARVLLQLGDLEGAAREYDAAAYAVHLPGDRRLYYRDRIELELRRERPAAARAYVDSMLSDTTAALQPQFATAFGLFSLDQYSVPDSIRAIAYRARAAWSPAFAGIVAADFDSIEARLIRFSAIPTPVIEKAVYRLSTIVAFHSRRRGPGLDSSTVEHPIVRFQAFLASGDTARARSILQGATDDIAALPTDWPFDDGQWLFSAESWLELGDSTRALSLMQDWGRRWPRFHQNAGNLLQTFPVSGSSIRILSRAWLLFADLSLAAGRRDDARRGYRMVLGMWERGEAPVQPIVARVRATLAQLEP